MKKQTILAALIMMAGIFLLSYFTMWWLAVLWVVVIAYVMKLDIKAGMTAGGSAFAFVWVAFALYMNAQDSAGIISKTGVLLGGLSQWIMLAVVFLLSLITGFLSGWLGSAVGMYFRIRAAR
jgi:hypothetical protein